MVPAVFTPQEDAHPAIGEIGEEESVQEAKIEVIFPETITEKVLQAMVEAHPYENPPMTFIPWITCLSIMGSGE